MMMMMMMMMSSGYGYTLSPPPPVASVVSPASFLSKRPSSPSSSSSSSSPSSSSSSSSVSCLRRRCLLLSPLILPPLFLPSLSFPNPPPAIASDSADDYETLSQWYRFEGDGFSLNVPPDFEDIREPDDDNAGGPLYGNKAKPKVFAARFASPDRKEVLSVVVKQSSQLKLSFLAIKDVTDLGSLREASNIFVPSGAKLYAAKAITSSDEERTYYYYEFAKGSNYTAIEAGATSGKIFVLGVTAPKNKWKDDSRRLRLAAKSFSVL